MTEISLIVAMDENGLIGNGDALPWHLPADLAHFRKHTLGKPVIMGRRTHESIGRPLPDRRNIVLSSDSALTVDGCEVVGSLQAALASCRDEPEAMVIGGATVYAQALPLTRRILLTRVHGEFEGDTWFPELDGDWVEVSRERHEADDRNPVACSFIELRRREAA